MHHGYITGTQISSMVMAINGIMEGRGGGVPRGPGPACAPGQPRSRNVAPDVGPWCTGGTGAARRAPLALACM